MGQNAVTFMVHDKVETVNRAKKEAAIFFRGDNSLGILERGVQWCERQVCRENWS